MNNAIFISKTSIWIMVHQHTTGGILSKPCKSNFSNLKFLAFILSVKPHKFKPVVHSAKDNGKPVTVSSVSLHWVISFVDCSV
jgi:hypothetical protein